MKHLIHDHDHWRAWLCSPKWIPVYQRVAMRLAPVERLATVAA